MKLPILILLLVFLLACSPSNKSGSKPWNEKMQSVPGRIECELYDQGGEGIAYHDTDSINNGSGKLNPANGNFLNEFRKNEGVDISYTKTNGIDDNPYNKVAPVPNSLYVGWTVPGEWINYTIRALRTSVYKVGIQYTANGDGTIALDVDSKQSNPRLNIPSTNNASDTIAWRQWHHWNHLDSLTSIKLSKGIHTLRLRIIDNGNMNFDYLELNRQ
jgi:DUF5010 C-terminal domain